MNRIYYSAYGPFIAQFIALKNSLGYKYKDAGCALGLLDSLAFKKEITTVAITKEFADEYCIKRANESEKTRYNRIQIFAEFARFLGNLGIRSHVPLLPKFKNCFTPYIFSNEQMQAIFKICDNLSPNSRNHNSAVFAIPFLMRLLYGTGLRVNAALYLLCSDIELSQKYLTLKNTKNGKDRIVPMSDSLAFICGQYLTYRNLFHGVKRSDRLFILPNGRPLSSFTAYKWFRKIIWEARISHGGRGKGPRLHDLRHTFSVHSLAIMSRNGFDMYHSLPLLSTYLGHQSLGATENYVRLTAEMYPDLIKESAGISASVFSSITKNENNNETH